MGRMLRDVRKFARHPAVERVVQEQIRVALAWSAARPQPIIPAEWSWLAPSDTSRADERLLMRSMWQGIAGPGRELPLEMIEP